MVQSPSFELSTVINLVNCYLMIYVSSGKKAKNKLCSCLLLNHWRWNCFDAIPPLEVVLKAGTHVMAPKETNPSNELTESDLNLAQQS